MQQGSLGQALEGRPELELTGLALEFDRQGFVRRCCQWEQARAWGQEVPPIRAIWESQASGLLASAEGLLASGLLASGLLASASGLLASGLLASAEGLLASVQELLALAEELQQEQMGLAPVSVHRGFGKRHCQWERAKELRVHSAIQAILGSQPLAEERDASLRRAVARDGSRKREARGEFQRQGGHRSKKQ